MALGAPLSACRAPATLSDGLRRHQPQLFAAGDNGGSRDPQPPSLPPRGLQAAWSLLEEHGRGVGWGSAAFASSRINSANLKRGACLEAQGSVIVPAGNTSSLGPNPVSLQVQQAQGTTSPLPCSCLPGVSPTCSLCHFFFFAGFPHCSCHSFPRHLLV